MAKLEGFSKVAVVNYGGYSDYHFAIYEDGIDYQVGDMVVCSNGSTPAKIKEIVDLEEATIEEMTRKFIKRNGEELFRSFANTIVGMMHSDKWSVTYDWMHDNFTFLEGEKDGQIITKFVELVETNKL